ncbi:MAG TPA: hypothetical protein PLX35_03905, partial [Cyclobacteriaceae bacterium]|nr:hypothetical protein [Cyclobacteriaceae bacterium]
MPDFYSVKSFFFCNLRRILLSVFGLLSLSAAGQTLVAPANPSNNLCIGVQQTLSDIQIAETTAGDFGSSGSNETFVLIPPANFQFVPATGNAVSTANELTIISFTTLAGSATITVANPTTASLDIITISGLQIEAISPASSGNIVRPAGVAGGSLVVTGQANSGSGTSFGFVSSIEQPAIVSSPSSAVRCVGTSVSFTGSASGAGITYQWEEDQGSGFSSVTNGGQYSGATTGTLTISGLTTSQTGYVYRLVASGTCAPPATSATATLTVNANPTAGLSSDAPSNTICAGTTVTFTASGGSNYQFFLDGISVQNSASATYANPALTNGQTVTVTVTNAAGCTASSSGIATTVNPVPVASLVSSDADNIICSGTSVVFTATPSAANYEFKKNGVTVQNSASSTYTDAALVNGDALQVLVTSAAGCVGTSGTITTTVNPNPVLSSTLTPADICSGSSFTYTATSATGGATFLWSRSAVVGIAEGPSSAAGANISETLTNTTVLPVSVVYRFITSASGCSTPENVTVVVNPIPSLSSGLSPASVCSGAPFSYTATSGTPGATFSWTRATIAGITPAGPTSGTNTIAETLSNSTAAPIAVTYAFTISANGCSQVQNVVVNINPQPAISSSLSPTGICSGTSFNYTPTSTTAGTTYAWTRAVVGGISQGAGSGTGAINEVLTNTTAAPVNVTYIYTLTANGCTNPSTFSVVVPVNPTPQLSSALSAALCNGSAFSYTATSATAGASFSWTRAVVGGISNSAGSGLLPTINETLNNITTSPISVTYAFVVSANGCNNAQNVVVTVNPVPVLSSTLSPAAICSGSTFNYTGTSATPAATLSWSRATVAGITPIGPTSGFTSISEALTNTTASPIVVTYAFVTSANGCNSGQNVLVTVQPDPVLTSTLTPAAICSGTLFTYAPTSSTAGATFSWSRSVVAGISQGAASGTGAVSEVLTNTSASPVSVTYVYSVSANGCANPSTANVVVVVNPTPVLSSSLAVPTCSATTFNYSATSATAGVSFSWSRAVVAGISEAASSGLTGTISETLTNLTNTPLVVTYSFVISANGCNNAENVLVTVNPTPLLSSTTTPAAICSGAAFSYTATSAVSGVSYSWTRSAVAGISEAGSSGLVANINETLTNTTSSPVVVTYAFVLSANGCVNGQNVTVTVQPTPVANVVAGQILCNGSGTSAVSFTGVATQYNWTNDTPSIGLAASGVGNIPVFTALNSGTSPVVATITVTPLYSGCSGSTITFTYRVNPTPVLTSTLTPAAICS